MKAKKCSKCQTIFTCSNPQPGCWCEGVRLTPETLEQLKASYEDCLCPACLKSFEQTNTEATSTVSA
ncbi:cysteine-rich CWC family protein [Flavisolibacter tropicus]|uniref:Cysteine-rich CWC n=1 Tax=Flavisolibacter tropicus TaxID=1492898 RepID=A0A172TQ33_9BACT|nr:hypothetical protein SY85_00225 [Flavisolibacter tropicus]